ncbi:MAG TPA: biosynthetic-type acetolactate synthase large subunit [Desulfotomaculum sp.]|nr:MAG: Acetolactate synthase [Desulfotomaculum sp. 46_80]HAG11098.1 biosynthetic-type acetolactate synthase large subunit [Desulfotomaculum sp.]HBY03588.1 biosynthetic-type acetolactate synthase large subunit [Desulfotomaculum sp.]
MEITAAQALVRCLEKENIEIIFGIPGAAIAPVYDALYNSKIKHVLVRHEQGAVHAADGYARATGRVGVCMATSGPGATNLVTGIANAYMDSVPIVVITGQVNTERVGTDAFQEVDTTGITIPITKHNFLLKDPAQLGETVKKAFYIASTGRSGPVLIDLPGDVTSSKIKFKYPETVKLRGYKPTYRGHPNMIKEAARLIGEARRPVIYAGGGILSSSAFGELKQLAETIDAPVTNTFMGLSSFPGDHPLFLGMLGLHGTRYANMAITECDLLIALGARFDDRVTGRISAFAPDAKIIHIDIDPAEIGKNVKINIPVVGDVKQVLQSLLTQVKKTERPEWHKRIQELKEAYQMRYSREGGLKPQFIVERLNAETGGDSLVVTDVGQHQMWVAQYYRFNKPRMLISSGGLGTMGFGLPAAAGAQLGIPGQQVVLITGDGSFQMTIQELATVKEQNLPLKIFILNNQRLGMVRQFQQVYYEGRYMAVDFLFHPDFEVLARAYGIDGFTIRSEEDAVRMLPGILKSPGPALVNCLVYPEENVIPMVPAGKGIDEAIEFAEGESKL